MGGKNPISASVLFTQDELQKYKLWRLLELRDVIKNNETVPLPTAYEFRGYQEWRAKRSTRQPPPNLVHSGEDRAEPHRDDQGSRADAASADFVLATRCRHPLHPRHPAAIPSQRSAENEDNEGKETVLWCPSCILQIHLTLVVKLLEKWLAVGGPWRKLPYGASAEDFQAAKQAYYRRKVDYINEMDVLDDIAQAEAAWETLHSKVNVGGAKQYGATKAVDTYRRGITFPARLAEVGEVPPQPPQPSSSQRKQKRLSYSPGTPEDTRHRPNGLYARGSMVYDPNSPHACPDNEGWEDTSYLHSWQYNVRQCRLLLCNKAPSLPSVVYRELTGDQSKDRLLEGIMVWFGAMTDPEWVQSWSSILAATTDIFVAWKSDNFVGEEDGFNNWDKIESLAGSNLEAYALQIGDIDEEDLIAHRGFQPQEEPPTEDEDEDEDFFDQSSLASDQGSADETVDLTESEDDDDDEDVNMEEL